MAYLRGNRKINPLDINKNIPPKNRLEESIAMNVISAVNGADILRVHDVKEAKECVNLLQELK